MSGTAAQSCFGSYRCVLASCSFFALKPSISLVVNGCGQAKLKLARSKIHGWGVFAVESVETGDFVIEYVGEVVRPRVSICFKGFCRDMFLQESILFYECTLVCRYQILESNIIKTWALGVVICFVLMMRWW